MKNLKTLCILFLSVVIISCSKKDDDGGGSAFDPEFSAAINGGPFSNYTFVLDYYDIDAQSLPGCMTINVNDTNGNIIRLFLNSTGGLGGGIVKEIGNVDDDGFATNALFRDQAAQITYTAPSGSISITNNIENPDDSGSRLVSGNFNFEANTGTVVTVTGSFEDLGFTPL